MRTIKAPGIQVNEIDKSDYSTNSFTGTTVLIPGFTTKGDDYSPMYFSSMNNFLEVYGYPETLAEKYFYNAAKEVFNSGNLLIGAKLPYDNKSLNNFTYTRYTVDDKISNLSAPIDILEKDYNGKTLSDLFFLKSVKPKSIISNEISNILFIQDFNTWLSSHSMIDYSLISSFNEIFNSEYCFENLDKMFSLSGNLEINSHTEDIHFITNLELKNAILKTIPSSASEIPTLNKTREKFTEFSQSFRSMMDISENSDTPDISSDISGDISNEDILKIYEKFKLANLSSSNYIKEEFLKGLSLTDIEKYYKNYQSINDLSNYVPNLSSISADFNLEFTAIKETFPNITTFRKINSFKRLEINEKTGSGLINSGLINMDNLDELLIGLESNLSENEFIIIDRTRGQYKRDKTMQDSEKGTNQYLGIVPIITTVANALYFQNILNSKDTFTPYNAISSINTVFSDDANANNQMLPEVSDGTNYDIPLASNDSTIETVSKNVTQFFPKIGWKKENEIDTTYFNQIGVVVCKMLINSSSYNRITVSPVESFIGSFDKKAKDPITNSSIFIDDIINNNSNYIYFFSNVKKVENCDMLLISNQTATSLGFFESDCVKNISVEKSIFEGLDIIFKKLSDTNRINIDLLVDAGMSDICHFIGTSCKDQIGMYEPTKNITGSYQNINANSLYYWRNIIQKYDIFCKDTRKDCMFICDAPRALALEGNLQLVRKTKPQNTVENSILPKIRFLTGINTSYGAGYCNWFNIIDDISYVSMWVPATIKVLGCYLRSNDWEAPAGLNRGRILNAYNLAFNPTHKEAETFYENNWNYAISYPLDGIITEGQKTFQKNKTAFDRVNVRRTFLFIEKQIKSISRGLLYEKITEYELSRFRDRIVSYMDRVKNVNAILDYAVICDSRNNNAQTVDNNEVHVAIGIKPTKVAEFIVLNFVCTTQGANIEEITSGSI